MQKCANTSIKQYKVEESELKFVGKLRSQLC